MKGSETMKNDLPRKRHVVPLIVALLLSVTFVTPAYGITNSSISPIVPTTPTTTLPITPIIPSITTSSPITPTSPTTPILPDDDLILPKVNLEYDYTVANEKATITKYKGSSANVTIPSQLGRYPVKVIGINAFNGNKTIKSVVIPEGVTTLEDMSFDYCSNLSSVVLPSTLTALKGEVFAHCTSLTGITLPDNLTVLDSFAFHHSGLTALTLPKSLTNYMRLYETNNLASINAAPDNTAYSSIDGVLYSKDKKYLYHYPVAKPDTAFNIPDGVTLVIPNSFYGAKYLQSVTIPASTLIASGFTQCKSLTTAKFLGSETKIDYKCFDGCSSLTSVTLPANLKIIKEETFEGCSSLKSISIPSTVTTIERKAFADCINLMSINLPSGLTEIQGHTFFGCKALPSITIPDSVQLVNNYSFYGCSNLSSITVPASVTKMGAGAFKNCTSLNDARFKGNAPAIGKELFANAASGFVIYYPSGKEGWSTPTWYGYPTKMYLSASDLPAIKVRLPLTFPIPSTSMVIPPLEVTTPGFNIPIVTPSDDEDPDLLPVIPGTEIPEQTSETNQQLSGSVAMVFTLEKNNYSVNGETKTMDVSPMVLEGRTVLPVRFAADPIGAKTEWNNTERKVTVTLGSTKLELWIGNNTALVNGVSTPIDPENAAVKPVIINGRTMLPMRFVTENLGCTIEWIQATKQINVNFKGDYLDPQPEPPRK